MSLSDLSATQVAAQIAAGQLTSRQATQHCLDAIDHLNPQLHAFNSIFPERALKQADAVDAARKSGQKLGLLAGVPITIKDNMCTTYGATTCSSRMLQNFHAPYAATVVEKLEAAGAVILGKTNLDEFAMGSSTENSAFGPTKNPWNTSCVPGGSSGGAAASCAARLGFGSLGSDTGGSIRQPASLCGIVGLKPTYGLVSRYGLVAFASSLDQIGPLTTTVEDTALFLQVIAGHDEKDSTSWPEAVPDYLADLKTPIKGFRIGLPREYYNVEGMEPEVKAAVLKALDWYKSQGATLVDISLPYTNYGIAAYYIIAPAEASSNLARYDGVHYGHRTAKPEDLIDLYAASRGEGFGPEVKRRIMLGTYALSSEYEDRYYLQALKVRRLIKQDFDNAFQKCDVIAGPTSPLVAFPIGSKTENPLAMYLCDVFTVTCNIAGIPGLALPCGMSSTGLPIGLQLLGPTFSEKTLLRTAHHYESAHEWSKKKPPALCLTPSANPELDPSMPRRKPRWPQDWNAPIPDDVRGLIFDCDGTLVDTMPLHFAAWCKTVEPYKVQVPEDFFYALGGMPTIGIAKELAAKLGISWDPVAAAHEKERVYVSSLADLEPIHRVVEIARRERGIRKLAVASGGWKRVVKESLAVIGVENLFDAIVGADDVEHGKPAPDVFLRAAEVLGLSPESCVVYEDGELGFQAAKAAGMRLIDVRPWYNK